MLSFSKNILYLGTLIPNTEFERIIKYDKTPQIATHLFSWKLFNSIKFFNDNLYIISTRPITDFPNNSSKINYKKKWKYDFHSINEIFFINIPLLKTLTLIISSFCYSLIWFFKTNKNNRNCVFLDNYQLPYLIVGYIFSKFCRIPIICVLTDPPNMNYKFIRDSKIKSLFRKLNSIFSNYFLSKLDGVIAVTKYLALEYCPNSKHLIIEAIGEGNPNPKKISSEKFVIIYSGGISLQYGIRNLLEAFIDLKYVDLELWFYGRGDAEALINDFSKIDYRIKYKGCVSNDFIKKAQAEANLLINPRPITLADGKFSFPSKILEYIESGTPALVTKLIGIPDEYNEFLFFFDSSNKEDIKSKITEIYKMDTSKLINKGILAKKFAIKKNVINQGRKINQFINTLNSN